jgi:hypothetical protein
MNVEIGTEAAQFLSWEYINGIFVALQGYSPSKGFFVILFVIVRKCTIFHLCAKLVLSWNHSTETELYCRLGITITDTIILLIKSRKKTAKIRLSLAAERHESDRYGGWSPHSWAIKKWMTTFFNSFLLTGWSQINEGIHIFFYRWVFFYLPFIFPKTYLKSLKIHVETHKLFTKYIVHTRILCIVLWYKYYSIIKIDIFFFWLNNNFLVRYPASFTTSLSPYTTLSFYASSLNKLSLLPIPPPFFLPPPPPRRLAGLVAVYRHMLKFQTGAPRCLFKGLFNGGSPPASYRLRNLTRQILPRMRSFYSPLLCKALLTSALHHRSVGTLFTPYLLIPHSPCSPMLCRDPLTLTPARGDPTHLFSVEAPIAPDV